MNIFSKEAIDDLNHFGIKPLPVLQVKEKNMKQPAKPVCVAFPITRLDETRERLMILCRNDDGIRDITDTTSYKVEDNCLKVLLSHFTDIVMYVLMYLL